MPAILKTSASSKQTFYLLPFITNWADLAVAIRLCYLKDMLP